MKFYSGYWIATLLTAVGGTWFTYGLHMELLEDNTSVQTLLLSTGATAFFFAFIMAYVGIGMRSLEIGNGSIKIRNFFTTRVINIDSIIGIRRKEIRPPFFNNSNRNPERFVVAYKDAQDNIRFASTPLESLVFGQRVYKFLQSLLDRYPNIPIFEESFEGALKRNKIVVSNPIDEFPVQRDETRALLKSLGLLPRFSEATLFLMSISLFFLLFTNITLWEDIGLIFQMAAESNSNKSGNIIIFLIAIFIGSLVSLYHTFSSAEKSTTAKSLMIIFGVGMTAGTSIGIGYHLWDELNYYNAVPVLWNLIYGTWLLLTFDKYLGEDAVSDRNAKLHEIVLGMVVIGGIIYFGQVKLDAYWAFIYSACIAYATAANRYVNDAVVFFNAKRRRKLMSQIWG